MFESPYFLWLRRAELSITKQEFSLMLSRSHVNTCALLQSGYIAFRELNNFLEATWVLIALEVGLSQLFPISAHSAKTETWTPSVSVSYKKSQNKTKTPKQTKNQDRPQVWQDLAQSEDIELYCLFYQGAIQLLGYKSYCLAQDHQRAQITWNYAGLWSVS